MAGDASAGKITIEIAVLDQLTADAKRMQKSLEELGGGAQKVESKLDKFQKKAASVGKSMTLKLSAPILGAGAASFKMAADFEKSMTKITTLVGISAKEVKAMEKDVMALAGETAQAPKDLADAMFFITSAGLRGAAATETLEAAAKAAAVGLGEASTIADLATSALNAYGEENLSATQATDVMVAAVREGKLEAEELAGSMGRVLPIASAMGVGFNEVGAAFAALSRTGTNAAEAATQVRGIMASLLRPTKQAEEALSGMGLSSENLRSQLKEKGLLSTLETLSEKFAGNEAAAASVFGNIRALSGVMDLMGTNVEGTRQIFENMTDTTGMLSEAFEGTADMASFKLSQAMVEFKKSMIVLGQQVLPVVVPIIENIGKFIARAAQAFDNLSPGIKKAIVIIAGLTAVVGPALMAISMMITAIKTIKAVMMAANPWFLAIGAAIAIVGIVMAKRSQDAANFKKEVQKTQDVLMTINPEIEGVTTRLKSLADTLPNAADPMGELAEKAKEVGTESLYAAKVTGTDLYNSFKKIRDAGVEVEKVLVKDISKLDKFITEVDRGNGVTNAAMNEIKGMSKEGRQLARELATLHDAEEITIKDMRRLVEDIEEVNAALEEATKQSKETAGEFLKSEDTYKIITQQLGYTSAAADDLHNELLQMAKDADDPRVALRKLEDQVEEVAFAHNFAASEFADFREEAAAVAEQSEKVVKTWEDLVEVADRKALYFTLELDTTGLYEQLNEAMSAIIDIGSMMPGGDSAMLDEQLAISRRISLELVGTKEADASASLAANKAANAAAKAAAKAAQAAHDAAVQEAQRAFDSFVSTTIGMGGAAISESFAEAIVGSPEDIKQAFNDLFNTAFDSGLTQIPELRSAFNKALEGQQLLIDIANKRTLLTQTLENAEDRLTRALENQATAQAKVNRLAQDRASLASKTASAFGFKFGEDIGAKAQADLLLAKYTSFEGNLKSLQTKGFPSDIISQVIGLGAFAGNDAAEGLLAMGETDFAAFTTALTGISAMGAKIGDIEAGMKFGGLQAAAGASLLGATAGAEGALAARDLQKMLLATEEAKLKTIAEGIQKVFGGDIEAFVQSLGPLSEQQAHELAIFSATLQELTTGVGRGINDVLNNEALGKIPELLAAKAFNAAVMPLGTKGDPIIVSDPALLEAAKVGAGQTAAQLSAGLFNQQTASAQAINRAVTEMAGGAGFAEADAASLGIAGTLRNRVSSNMAYQAADASMLDSYSPKAGVTQNYFDIVIGGSVVSDKQLIEVVRQGSLEDQRSGKAWAIGVL